MIEKPEDSVMVKLVVSLLQLSKMAVNHAGEKAVLGKFLSPTDLPGLSLQAKFETVAVLNISSHCYSALAVRSLPC